MSWHSFYNQSQNDFKGQYHESFSETWWLSLDNINPFSGISCCPNKLLYFSGLKPQFIFPSSKYVHYVSLRALYHHFTPSLWHLDWRSSPSLGPYQPHGRRQMCEAFVGFLELAPRNGTDHFLSSFLTKANIMIPATTEIVLWWLFSAKFL